MSTLFGQQPNQFGSSFNTNQSQPTQGQSQFQQTIPQQSQSQPQPSQQSQQQPQQQQSSSQQVSQQQQKQYPTWFQNQKKRTIPNHLVPKKKASFQIGTNSNNNKKSSSSALHPSLISDDQYNLLSFGTNNRKTITGSSLLDKNTSVGSLFDVQLSSSNTTIDDLTKIDDSFDGGNDNIDSDLPPKKSMFDLGTESSKNLNVDNSKIDSFMNKDPTKFTNVFNVNKSTQDLEKLKINDVNGTETSKKDIIKELKHYNSAIIVFGYPEHLSLEIIKFFNNFGKILEEFNEAGGNDRHYATTLVNLRNSQNSNNGKIMPIFSGKHWIKLTYDNPNSALQALQENGNVFNGSIIGVVPYHKSIIEKLEKRKIFTNDDIGDGNLDIPLDKINEIINQQSKIVNNNSTKSQDINTGAGTTTTTATSYNVLDIKPADNHFFLKNDSSNDKTQKEKANEDKNKEKLGMLGTLSKYIFGFHDL
ncbi:ASM4 Nucleoporin ASM4 [Candida maltosa Xu316]